MSVLIRGMEMPTDCIRCPFCEYEQGYCLAANEMDTEPREIGKRHKDCPLDPVPEHGRLIDADAFAAKIIEIVERQKYDDFYAKSLSVGAILRDVVIELKGMGLDGYANAPTIIPAKEEE